MKNLEELYSTLEAHEHVDAVFVTGSTAIGTETSDSDVDMVIVLNENSHEIRSVYELVDGKFADIFFFTKSDVEFLLSSEEVSANEMRGMLVTWVQKSKIVFDKSQMLTKLKERIDRIKLFVTEDEKFRGLQAVSYSWFHNQRYYRSGKQEYLAALEIRLCQSVLEIFTTYFTVRGLPWRGEKQAVKVIAEKCPALHEAWENFLAAPEIEGRMQAYETMVREMMPEGVDLLKYDEAVVIGNNPSIKGDVLSKYWQDITS